MHRSLGFGPEIFLGANLLPARPVLPVIPLLPRREVRINLQLPNYRTFITGSFLLLTTIFNPTGLISSKAHDEHPFPVIIVFAFSLSTCHTSVQGLQCFVTSFQLLLGSSLSCNPLFFAKTNASIFPTRISYSLSSEPLPALFSLHGLSLLHHV